MCLRKYGKPTKFISENSDRWREGKSPPVSHLCGFLSLSVSQLSYTWLKNENSPSRRRRGETILPEERRKTDLFCKSSDLALFLGCFGAWWDKLLPAEPVQRSEKNILLWQKTKRTKDVCGCLFRFMLIHLVGYDNYSWTPFQHPGVLDFVFDTVFFYFVSVRICCLFFNITLCVWFYVLIFQHRLC